MADVAVSPVVPEVTPKKSAKNLPKTARAKASHPPTAIMVNSAIKSLKERGGSSLQAIKKYVSSTYKVDAEKLAPFIKKFIKASVVSGALVQTKGKGASGSFKLASTVVSKKPAATVKKTARQAAKTAAKPKTTPKTAVKKTVPVKEGKSRRGGQVFVWLPSPEKAKITPKAATPVKKAKSKAKVTPKTATPVKKTNKPVKKTTIVKRTATSRAKKVTPKRK